MKTKEIFILYIPKDGTREPYTSMRMAQKAMKLAVDHYMWNYYLNDIEDVVVRIGDTDATILTSSGAIIWYFRIIRQTLNNLEQFKH